MQKELQEFVLKLEHFKASEVSAFPDIDLYMDQVITFLERIPSVYRVNGEMQITPNMVNNYVKEGYLPRPTNKKYDRDQLIQLFLLTQLKPVLPIPVVSEGLRGIEGGLTLLGIYEMFAQQQEESFKKIAERIRGEWDVANKESGETFFFALRLAAEANALRLAAEQLLTGLSKQAGETSGAKT
jgi:hypothetical protein